MALNLLSLLSITSFFLFFMFVRAQVPPSEQFRYVNDGDFGESTAEYGANYRVLEPIGHPFRLCFYNITPNVFFLAIRMGTESSESIMRWVWEANRNEPVRDQATLTFAADGNLVLADADGKVAWQTGTANRGVVGLKLLENGNLVLFNADGQFVWQSFDFPTDTLLVGQSLRLAGSNKLLSRDHGLYNLVLEPKRLVLSYSIPKTNKSVVYFVREGHFDPYTTLSVEPGEGFSTQLSLITPGLFPQFPMRHFLARPRFNATLSFLRLDVDGNLRIYTYDFQVSSLVWEVTFELFDRDRENECLWPSRCGEFGLCEESQCVACPTEKVPLGCEVRVPLRRGIDGQAGRPGGKNEDCGGREEASGEKMWVRFSLEAENETLTLTYPKDMWTGPSCEEGWAGGKMGCSRGSGPNEFRGPAEIKIEGPEWILSSPNAHILQNVFEEIAPVKQNYNSVRNLNKS